MRNKLNRVHLMTSFGILFILLKLTHYAAAFTTSSRFISSDGTFLTTKSSTTMTTRYRTHRRPVFIYSAPISTQDQAITSNDDNNGNDSSGDDADEWWKTYEFQFDDVAKETRNEFPILNEKVGPDDDPKPLVYLDSAATSQKPNFVINKIKEYYETYNSNVHRGAHTLSQKATSEYENARDVVKNFINAKSRNEVVFTSGATEAINLIAQSYGRTFLKEDDEIIYSIMEHHSNIIPWQLLHNQIGCKINHIRLGNDGNLDFDDMYENLISEKTKIITFQHVSNTMGCINNVKGIVSKIRSINPEIIIIIDACQSTPHMAVDVQDLDIDFLVASGHKMCGPTGIGFLWGREELLNKMSPYMGGGEMIDYVSVDDITKTTYASSPAKFEAGTPQIGQAIGMGYAIQYLTDHVPGGLERITKYEHELSYYLYRRLEEVDGVTIYGPKVNDDGSNRASLCSFNVEGIHSSDLSTFLDLEGIAIRSGHHCCQPLHQEALGVSHSSRASLYFYNTKEDVDIFIDKLKGVIKFFNDMNALGGNKSEDDDNKDSKDEEEFVPFI